MTRRPIYAEGPGLKPNSMGIWQNEAGWTLYEDAEMEQRAAEREAKRARVNAATSLANNITDSMFFQFIEGWNDGESE
jgi:hypothetical protein